MPQGLVMKLSRRFLRGEERRPSISCRMNYRTGTTVQGFHLITPERNKSMSPEHILRRKDERNLTSGIYHALFVLAGTGIILHFLCFIS
jgi:hypothetical protein